MHDVNGGVTVTESSHRRDYLAVTWQGQIIAQPGLEQIAKDIQRLGLRCLVREKVEKQLNGGGLFRAQV